MRNSLAVLMATMVLVTASITWAQAASGVMVTPDALKWAAMPTLPAGAEIALIEGSKETIFSEAVPFTFQSRLPADDPRKE